MGASGRKQRAGRFADQRKTYPDQVYAYFGDGRYPKIQLNCWQPLLPGDVRKIRVRYADAGAKTRLNGSQSQVALGECALRQPAELDHEADPEWRPLRGIARADLVADFIVRKMRLWP